MIRIQHRRLMKLLVFAVLLSLTLLATTPAMAGKSAKRNKHSAPPPVRIHFSGNLEGELEPCG